MSATIKVNLSCEICGKKEEVDLELELGKESMKIRYSNLPHGYHNEDMGKTNWRKETKSGYGTWPEQVLVCSTFCANKC